MKFYLKAFAFIFVVTFLGSLGYFYLQRQPNRMAVEVAAPRLRQLTGNIRVAAQLTPKDISALRIQGVRALIDLRPDGEAPDQPSSVEMRAAAEAAGMTFAYTPTPHGAVPGNVVENFDQALKSAAGGADGTIVLFCRSGARAVRVWALAEASRADGLSLTEIEKAAANASYSVADVHDELVRRISLRKPK